MKTTRLYDDLAWLWRFWGTPAEYADYCAHVTGLINEHALIPVHTLLNIGCGGGKNIYNLKDRFEITGLDLSPSMLALARELNPETEFLQGDMRSFSLDRTFDAVLLDDAVSYMASKEDLQAAFATAWRHLKYGGVMVVGPDDTKETFVQNRTSVTQGDTRNESDSLQVVFVENAYDPDPYDEHYEGTMVYLIREGGKLRIETDHHILGLFSLDVWQETLAEVGFKLHQDSYVEDGEEYFMFVCLKSA